MLITRTDGTYNAGPLDIICILFLSKSVSSNYHDTYHAAFFVENPLPGPVLYARDTKLVRLKSQMHHTAGAKTLAEARLHVEGMRREIHIADANVVTSAAVPVADAVNVWLIPNWDGDGEELRKSIGAVAVDTEVTPIKTQEGHHDRAGD